MTDHELRDLMHERVADLTVPDLSGDAWARASRIRRRRTTGVVAGAVASVAVVAVALAGVPGLDRSSAPAPGPATQRPSPNASTAPTTPHSPRTPGHPAPSSGAQATDPDGRFEGWPVYWGPTAAQEDTLPPVPTPLPAVIDLSAAAPDLADRPITSALAAYALLDDAGGARLLLLAPDGSLRTVDTSRVAPYDDGAGEDISVANQYVLSPTGEYLAFPQPSGRVLVLTLATGEWRTIDTGRGQVVTMQWMGTTDLWFPPTTQGGQGALYSVVDGTRVGSAGVTAPLSPFDPGAGPYGRWRMGPGGTAQAWTGVTGLPVVADERTPSQVLLVQGDAPLRDALLVLGDSTSPIDRERPEECCSVEFWLGEHTVVYESASDPRRLIAWQVGTHGVGVVSTIEGYDADRTTLVSSYARIWDR